MAITAMGMAHKTKLSAVCIALICSKLAVAGEWQFDPSIIVDETYSDNVGLTTNNEQSADRKSTRLNSSH